MVTVFWKHWVREDGAGVYQTQHRAGLLLLSEGLSRLHGWSVPPEELDGLLAQGEHGKPFLPGLPEARFSVSHCKGLAVCAFAREEVGADVERPAPFTPRLPGKVLTAEEQAFLDRWGVDEEKRQELFFRLWTLKESLIKQSGEGLSRPLSAFSFRLPDYPDIGRICCSQAGLYFVQRQLAEGYILSVCSPVPIGELRIIAV